ncbi:heavy metal translocating P-type ATPase [Herbiconiux sp. VKM Ac-1786]|uniref:heavy metal translocating P-type ATPase n=1 Tax=Herbiconiux sp. VKM Ac-1786 TaxID=2783824 RepID=UPI00188AAEB3|nr:heavy metal translocating P-type ATPase [Herbiconiux sp. VKM Ac-1786]MBF4572328.1 heavy metal translocating P-type ATPase [Herbiconiux sp. VKM Ac-1786]
MPEHQHSPAPQHDAHEHADAHSEHEDGHGGHDAHAGHDHGGHDAHDHSAHAGHGGHGGHDGHDHSGHVAMFRRLFWVMLVVAVPVVAFSSMFAEILGYELPADGPTTFISPILGTVMFVIGGRPFLTGGVDELRAKQPGMMLLIALAITVAFVASWGATLGLLDHQLDFWWELALLIVIMLLGHWIEMRSLAQTTSALDSLAALLPDESERIDADGTGTTTVAPADLVVGDLVIVRPGGRVPADGEIAEGTADLDESMITGESKPVTRGPGAHVVAGTVATDTALRIRITAVGDDTALAGIQRLVTEAQNSSSRAQRIADVAAGWLFWFALGSAIITAVVWTLVGSPDDAVIRTITVLVIACPHALGLAIPLVVSIATERAAKAGILVKDRLALETMRTVDTALFDKTGTLTKGAPVVTSITPAAGIDESELLALAAAAESDSEHPLARAIVEAARMRGLTLPAATAFTSSPAVGVSARIADARGRTATVHVGGPRLLEQHAAHPLAAPAREATARDATAHNATAHDTTAHGATAHDATAHNATAHGTTAHDATAVATATSDTVLHVLRDHEVIGRITLADEIRPESRTAVDGLHRQGVEVVMITGDAEPVAQAVAAELGITRVFAGVRPEDKAAKVAELQSEGRTVAMVGDGVNDAPALARADVGIAIGAGTDVAIASAGVILASDDPRSVLSVIRLSKAGYRKMTQNLWWAAGYNLLSVPLAAGVLAPIGFILPMSVGAILMSLSTIIVALNAQLLRRLDLRPAPLPAANASTTGPTGAPAADTTGAPSTRIDA